MSPHVVSNNELQSFTILRGHSIAIHCLHETNYLVRSKCNQSKVHSFLPVECLRQLFYFDVFGFDGGPQLLNFRVAAGKLCIVVVLTGLEFVDLLNGFVVGLSVLVKGLLHPLELGRLGLTPSLPVAYHLLAQLFHHATASVTLILVNT